MDHKWPFGFPESAIREPSETIVFGEKQTDFTHIHMDFFQRSGDDLEVVEYNRHNNPQGRRGTGGSNFAFGDGSVRYLRSPKALYPVNLWAITDLWRQNTIVPP